VAPSEGKPEPVPLPPTDGPHRPPSDLSIPGNPAWTFTPTLELRTEVRFERLDHLDRRVEDKSPTISMGLSRVLPGVDASFGERLSARAAVWLVVDPVLRAGRTEPSLSMTLHETWLSIDFGQAGELVAGSQALPFGLRLVYSQDDWFYLPGAEAWLDMATRVGVTDPVQTAVAWQADLPLGIEVDVAAAQAREGSRVEQPWSVDLAGRARWHNDEGVLAGLSGLIRSRPDGHTHGAWHAYGGYRLARFDLRLLGEVLGTGGDGPDGFGYGLDAGASFDLAAGPLEGVNVVARYERWDPDRDAQWDHAWDAALGGDVGFGGAVRAGLLYELRIPSDVALAIEHHVTLQLKARI